MCIISASYQICTAGASDMCALADRLTSGLTYYSRSPESRCINSILAQLGGQVLTAAHRHL